MKRHVERLGAAYDHRTLVDLVEHQITGIQMELLADLLGYGNLPIG